MDWQRVKSVICEGRDFSLNEEGCRVLSDTLMPSGALIYVHLQSKFDHLTAHDGGAAFDELNRHGGVIKSLTGLRNMLSATNFRVAEDGAIWRERVSVEQAFDVISMVADASVRAAHFLLDHAKLPAAQPLDSRLKDVLRVRYPQGRPNYTFQGKNRQHTFDFGAVVGEQIILVQAVTPDSSSVSSAIVKGLDAKQAEGSNVVPLFVYDPEDRWPSDTLSMLQLGGVGVSIGSLGHSDLPVAA